LVISPSEGMEKVLREYGVETPIEVVPNGVDLKRFRNAIPLPRSEFGFKDEDILLIYAGRIAPEKNLEMLIQSFAGITRVVPNAHLLIVGGGQKEYRIEIETLPGEYEITDKVHFTGSISYDKIPSYIAMCDVFVTASITEVHPLSVIEAMGAGLPIVGIDSPGIGDSVDDGVSGLLANDDIAAYTAKLTYLCLSKDLQKQFGLAAKKKSDIYAIERTTDIMLRHYTRLAQGPRKKKQKLDERLMTILEEFLKKVE